MRTCAFLHVRFIAFGAHAVIAQFVSAIHVVPCWSLAYIAVTAVDRLAAPTALIDLFAHGIIYSRDANCRHWIKAKRRPHRSGRNCGAGTRM